MPTVAAFPCGLQPLESNDFSFDGVLMLSASCSMKSIVRTSYYALGSTARMAWNIQAGRMVVEKIQ